MTFPVALADYIAKACGLPSLFIGEFNGLEINYIWSITDEDAWKKPSHSTILISSNKWLRGLNYNWWENTSSKLVDLRAEEDTIVKLLRQHNAFINLSKLNDGYRLCVDFFHKYGYRTFAVSNPEYSGQPSIELGKAFDKIHQLIHNKAEQNQNVVAAAMSVVESKGNFAKFLEFAYSFGLSGSFEQANSPDNLEYILKLHIRSSANLVGHIFVQSSSWLRGAKFQHNYQGEEIVDLPETDVGWKQLLLEPHNEEQHRIDSLAYITLYRKGETIEIQVKLPDESDTSSPLWNALRPLIEQLNQE